LDRILPHKTKLEQHLKQRYGELFGAEFDVLLYDLTSTYVEGAAEKNPMMRRGYGPAASGAPAFSGNPRSVLSRPPPNLPRSTQSFCHPVIP
jgi:hypothetical protein